MDIKIRQTGYEKVQSATPAQSVSASAVSAEDQEKVRSGMGHVEDFTASVAKNSEHAVRQLEEMSKKTTDPDLRDQLLTLAKDQAEVMKNAQANKSIWQEIKEAWERLQKHIPW